MSPLSPGIKYIAKLRLSAETLNIIRTGRKEAMWRRQARVLYVGHRVDDETVAFKNDNGAVTRFIPDSSQELCNHSPSGFNWGYVGNKLAN